jgi:hypothetical protein
MLQVGTSAVVQEIADAAPDIVGTPNLGIVVVGSANSCKLAHGEVWYGVEQPEYLLRHRE